MFNFFKKSEPESPKTLSAWEQIIEVVKSDPKVSNLEATHHDITCQYQDLKLVINDNYITLKRLREHDLECTTYHQRVIPL